MSESIPQAGTTVVWRSPFILRLVAVLGFCAFAVLGVWIVTQQPDQLFAWIAALVMIVIFGFNGLMARRSCTLDAERLLAQGRFAIRRVELRDLRQAAIGVGGSVWIQTHQALDKRGGDVLSLRMIPVTGLSGSGYPTGDRAIDLIRARAAAAGAELDPPLPGRKTAPSRKALIFSI
ncbi:MAG: hypothetical protein QOI21_4147 [Actinomycetota bacterium]|nr:hypothetical protein [Actinomycetota bacterium]